LLIPAGKPHGGTTFTGGRNIEMPKSGAVTGKIVYFYPAQQDTEGDGTVSHHSGSGPLGKVRGLFRTTGFNHQESYKDEHMLNLTFHLIVRIAQEAK